METAINNNNDNISKHSTGSQPTLSLSLSLSLSLISHNITQTISRALKKEFRPDSSNEVKRLAHKNAPCTSSDRTDGNFCHPYLKACCSQRGTNQVIFFCFFAGFPKLYSLRLIRYMRQYIDKCIPYGESIACVTRL